MLQPYRWQHILHEEVQNSLIFQWHDQGYDQNSAEHALPVPSDHFRQLAA